MGFSRKRCGKDGKPRYTAYYHDLQDRQRSAGTFASKKEADRAWGKAEVALAEGRLGDPRRGRQTFAHYVATEWLPNHVMEPSTREGYTYQIGRHIMPWLGRMKMNTILPSHVREWISHLQDSGVSPATISNCRKILSGIFTTAVNDQVIVLHPCRGVKTPTVSTKPRRIITPEQFDVLYAALPDSDSQLLVETKLETGLRWGELTELRKHDFDSPTRSLTISRAVVELNPKFHPEGRRFFVKDYPKDKEYRRFRLSHEIVGKLVTHVQSHQRNNSDLLFTLCQNSTPKVRSVTPPLPAEPGFTDPTPTGRRYRHGTLSAYNAAKCRCPHCRHAFTTYRAKRRSLGKDHPRQARLTDTDGHIPRNWFRHNVWLPALSAAGLPFHVRIHDLRHAHASWLLAGGADLQTVKERLGHASIAT
ncbi:MAG TPA: site-specific integrase, partial [Mycobacteriales bacterium]